MRLVANCYILRLPLPLPYLWDRRQPRYSLAVHYIDRMPRRQTIKATLRRSPSGVLRRRLHGNGDDVTAVTSYRDVTRARDAATVAATTTHQLLRRNCDRRREEEIRMSRNDRAISAAVRRRRRVFPRGNPGSVLTAVFLLVVVVWSHAVFYRSAIVALPHYHRRSSTSTTPSAQANVSRRLQTQIPARWTSVEPFGASTTARGSLNPTAAAERWPSETAAKRVGSDRRIVVRETAAATERPAGEVETASGVDDVDDDVIDDLHYQSDAGARHDSQPMRERGSRDRDWLVSRPRGRSRLLSLADNRSLATASPSSSISSTSPARSVDWFLFYDL